LAGKADYHLQGAACQASGFVNNLRKDRHREKYSMGFSNITIKLVFNKIIQPIGSLYTKKIKQKVFFKVKEF